MIFDFDGLRITDNTQEQKDANLFLLTQQNSKYYDQAIPSITPSQLLEKLQLQDMKIVGVTGTNGKTTTAAAIYSILNDLGYKAALQGTRGFFIADEKRGGKSLTTPPILTTIHNLYQAKKEGCSHFCMEVSSHAIHQNRIEGLGFALKVFTNISQDHLDYHKDMQSYIATKSSFFADDCMKLINKEDKHIKYNVKNTRTYAIEEMATYQILAYSLQNGISALLRFGSTTVDFYSPLQGFFNLYNITAAIGAVHMLTNEDLANIAEVVEHFAGVKGRMEVVSEEPLIIVDFAHTPDGMQKVFESFGGKKIVALFGAGGDRDKKKRPLMGEVAGRFCTKIYLTSDNPRSENPEAIIADIKRGIKTNVPLFCITDRKEALQKAIDELQDDEILLVLGKGDEEYMQIGEEQVPFSDRDVIESILQQRK